METINHSTVEGGTEYELTFSRSGSLSAKASSLLSITEAAATSRGVAPRMDGEAKGRMHKTIRTPTHKLYMSGYWGFLLWGQDPKTLTSLLEPRKSQTRTIFSIQYNSPATHIYHLTETLNVTFI